MFYKELVPPSVSSSKSQNRLSSDPIIEIDRANLSIPSMISRIPNPRIPEFHHRSIRSPNPPIPSIPKAPNPPIPESHHRSVRSPYPPILESHHRSFRSPYPRIPSIPKTPKPPIIDPPDPFEQTYYKEPEDLLEKGRALCKSGGAAAAAAAAAEIQIAEDPPQPLPPPKLSLRTAIWLKGTPPKKNDRQLVWNSPNYLSSYTITHLTQVNESPIQTLHRIIKLQEAYALLDKKMDFLTSWLNPDPAAPPPDTSTFWEDYNSLQVAPAEPTK